MQVPPTIIEQSFTKRECIHFVPVSRGSDRCGCGRRRSRHRYIARDAQNIGPSGPWTVSRDTRQYPTDSYGVIEFQGGPYIRKAQFVRLDYDTAAENVMQLFCRMWNLERPKLVISVHGGLSNFDLQPKLATAFTKGLLKAAKTTGTWIITSGLNCGTVNYVAAALNAAGGSVRARKRLVSIGIVPWGLLNDRDDFIGTALTVPYNSKFVDSKEERVMTLNEMHTHFLLVDNGTVSKYGADMILRRRLEKYIAQQWISCDDNEEDMGNDGNRVPVVGVVLEGGAWTVKTILDYVTCPKPMSIVVCDGSGRAADLVAFAHRYGDPETQFPVQVKDAILGLIRSMFNFDGNKAQEMYKDLITCLQRKYAITIFRLGEDTHEDIDHEILAASLKGQDLTTLDCLRLTLSWNRSDIARSEIFSFGGAWNQRDLEVALMEALISDRVQFVDLLIEQGARIEKFLTFRRLEKLYNTKKGPSHTLLWVVRDVVPWFNAEYRVKLPDIGSMIEKLMGGDYHSHYCSQEFKQEYEKWRSHTGPSRLPLVDSKTKEDSDHRPFKEPFNDLFLWAVLTKRQSMALCMWQHGDEGLAKALIAAKLYDALAAEAADDYLEGEICEDFRNYSTKFQQIALELLEECYKAEAAMAFQMLTYELTNWGGRTCLSLAVAAKHMEFLAHPCCQVLLADLWHGGMRIRKRTNLRVLLGLFLPPMIFKLEFKTKHELLLQPQTEGERQEFLSSRYETDTCSSSSSQSDSDESSSLIKNKKRKQMLARSRALIRRISQRGKRKSTDRSSAESAVSSHYGATDGRAVGSVLSSHNEIAGSTSSMKQRQHRGSKHQRLGLAKRIKEFYQSPITTFWSWTIAYIVFLCAFTYMVLLRTCPQGPSIIELYVVAYIVSYTCEMIARLTAAEGKTVGQKFKVYFTDVWNLTTALAVWLFFIAVGLRFNADTRQIARILYSCDLVFWYVRLLDIMSINNKLGPYVTMIGKMIVSMLSIITILMVTLFAYGVFRQSLLYPNQDEWSWDFVRNITYKPYFMWYGEVYAAEIDNCREHGLDCVVGNWLSPVALTVYLMITNILLINLLIAIFNNIFLEVNAISQILWKFNRYSQVMEYKQKPWLPPPFTLIYYLYRFVKVCCWKRCTGQHGRRDNRLKLFLKLEDVEKLMDFEEECMEDLRRHKEETRATSSDVRLQETADRSSFISMKLDDVLAKQATQQNVTHALELEVETIKQELAVIATHASGPSSSGLLTPLPYCSQCTVSQSDPPTTPDGRIPSEPVGSYRFSGGSPQSDRPSRAIQESQWKRSLSLPWDDVPGSFQARGSREDGKRCRKTSLIYGSPEYTSIMDGIDVGECAALEGEWPFKHKASSIRPRHVPVLTPVSSRYGGFESEGAETESMITRLDEE